VDQHDYLKRGKEFLARATKLSLKVAPLALAAAGVANAGATYSFSTGSANGNCTFTGVGANCITSGGSPTATSPTALPGTIPFFIMGDNNSAVFENAGNPGSGGGTMAPILKWNGSISPGLLDGVTSPFHYDFFLSDSNGLSVSWTLTFTGQLTGSASGALPVTVSAITLAPLSGITCTGTDNVCGNGTLTSHSSATSLTVELDLSDSFNSFAGGTDTIAVTIPNNGTIDATVNSSQSAVPEPGSLLLIAPALGGFFVLRRIRKRG